MAGKIKQAALSADDTAVPEPPYFNARYLSRFPGPAILSDGDGQILANNQQGADLARYMKLPQGLKLVAMVRLAALEQLPLRESLRFRSETAPEPDRVKTAEDAVYDLSVLPLADGTVFLLGRDLTADRHLLDSLVASRALYKDLVNCSSDFAWETDATGIFRFISGDKPFGYDTAELIGLSADILAAGTDVQDGDADIGSVFSGREPVTRRQVVLRQMTGEPRWMQVSATPVFDRNSLYLGMRGVCRDITETRARRVEIEAHRRREAAGQGILKAIIENVDPADIVHGALNAAAAALNADQAWLFRWRQDRYDLMADYAALPDSDRAPLSLLPDWHRDLTQPAAGDFCPTGLLQNPPAKAAAIGATLAAAQERAGAIVLARQDGDAVWRDEAHHMLAQMIEPLGVALVQAAHKEELSRLARTDALTGLFNRRAFTEMITRRQLHLHRMGRFAALLFLDLDNFKTVNDTLGHAAGDQALKDLSGLIGSDHRAGDIAGRLGGDEFVMWLEETAHEGAARKAEILLEKFAAIAARYVCGSTRLGISIGIVIADPKSGRDVADLLAEADAAMYRAKEGGKNNYSFAPDIPATPPTKTRERP